jgi:hypothetical protein
LLGETATVGETFGITFARPSVENRELPLDEYFAVRGDRPSMEVNYWRTVVYKRVKDIDSVWRWRFVGDIGRPTDSMSYAFERGREEGLTPYQHIEDGRIALRLSDFLAPAWESRVRLGTISCTFRRERSRAVNERSLSYACFYPSPRYAISFRYMAQFGPMSQKKIEAFQKYTVANWWIPWTDMPPEERSLLR